eukprot:3301673-Amphidinium_carterae.1
MNCTLSSSPSFQSAIGASASDNQKFIKCCHGAIQCGNAESDEQCYSQSNLCDTYETIGNCWWVEAVKNVN